MTIIAIANQKGGVGKTTTAVTLSVLWGRGGSKVLLVDLDSQGNCADSLGMGAGRELSYLLTPGIGRFMPVYSGRDNLEVIRAGHDTVELKTILNGVMLKEMVLERAFNSTRTSADGRGKGSSIADLYDLVVMDCAPSVDILHTAALVAADYLLIPTRLDQFALKGIAEIIESVNFLHHAHVSHVKMLGILPTFYERQTKESQAQLEHLVDRFRTMVLPPIPQDTNIREANRAGKTILEFDKGSRSVVGVDVRGEMVGGYEQVLMRLDERMG